MKKSIFSIAVLAITLLSSCADNKNIDGITYRPYGILNENDVKNDSIIYDISYQAVASGIIFSEMFFIPTVYTFGFNLYEPIGKKSDYIKGEATK